MRDEECLKRIYCISNAAFCCGEPFCGNIYQSRQQFNQKQIKFKDVYKQEQVSPVSKAQYKQEQVEPE
ncbi:MAG: hypothetical protein P9L88_02790 [Candidatus Tantalella remota]|nr:hypothetical protein [Candidatus Tantalella remota]